MRRIRRATPLRAHGLCATICSPSRRSLQRISPSRCPPSARSAFSGTSRTTWTSRGAISAANVARSYLSRQAGWLAGSAEDPTQTRLPMYAVAAAFRVFGRSDLQFARGVSCAVSVLTLLAIYVYSRRFGRPQAWLSAALLATSPLFLAFSRVALTEGDAFVTAAVAWFVVSFAWALDRPSVGRTAVAGVLFGLALSAKFIAVALLPAIALAPWCASPLTRNSRGNRRAAAWIVLASACACLGAALVLGGMYWYRPRMPEQAGIAALAWLSGMAGYGAVTIWLARRRHQMIGRVAQPAVVAFLAGATFILLPPVHVTSPVLLGSLKNKLVESSGIDTVQIVQSASLHFMSLLLKPGLAVGVVLWVGVALAWWRWGIDRRVRLPLLAIATYGVFLVKMPVAQPFYTMPIFPWMLVLGADRIIALARRNGGAAAAIVGACAITVAADLWHTFPHYQLNGFQWLGARYVLGLSTLSYRSVVQVNSDGVEQALVWVKQHARPGERVKTYIRPDHIVRAVIPHPAFTLVDGFRPPSPSLDDVDYVITTLHGDIRKNSPGGLRGAGSVYQYPYDRAKLMRAFDPVFRVERPFGLEFATVWHRKASGDLAAPAQGERISP
jgi:4-amino-4-deoxy-L-arabinose transferase-like glycosyltransferase